MTPTDEPIEAPRLGTPNPFAPIVRPYYATLTEFERQVLDSRQAERSRELALDYDPFT